MASSVRLYLLQGLPFQTFNLHILSASYCKEQKWEKQEKGGEKEVELKAFQAM